MEKKGKNNYVWLVAYIHRDHIHRAEIELEQYGYEEEVEVYIPTVKMLQKKFKGKNVFEFVPLLFNYGFFKVPYKKACDPDFLIKLRSRITCIYGWVKDTTKLNETANLRRDNSDPVNALPGAAMATDKEISQMMKTSKSLGIFTADDLKRIKIGDSIILQGYPFDSMHAEVTHIDYKKGEVKVKLDMAELIREVTVSFENVFYTVYKDFNEEGKEKSTDEMDHKAGYGLTDNLLFNDIISMEDE